MGTKGEEKALIEFKHIIEDLVFLLRQSTGVETAYMLWVNRGRKQFVMEANSTTVSHVMFPDRVDFDDHFLSDYRNTRKSVQVDVKGVGLNHYYHDTPVLQATVIPFVNNGETVALTVLETSEAVALSRWESSVQAYTSALGNVLSTYLELTDLYGRQQEWVDYEESLNRFSPRLHKVEILHRALVEMQKLLPTGGVCLVARGMDTWVNVLHSSASALPPSLGLIIDEKSLAYDSLKNGEPEFAIHFNQNPKRLSASEPVTDGATFAIPLVIDDRRHATIVAYDRNPLIFKESVKHKLINILRVAGLAIRANLGRLPVEEDLLTSAYGSFIPEVWEKALETAMGTRHPLRKTWFGFIAIENLQMLRAKYRLEELQRLQKTLVVALNPSRFGFNGYIGFNSDYVCTFLLQGTGEKTAEEWLVEVRKMLTQPVSLSDGQQITVEIAAGYTQANGSDGTDVHQVIQEAKRSLSEAMKLSV